MDDEQLANLEIAIQQTARDISYPPTPNLARSISWRSLEQVKGPAYLQRRWFYLAVTMTLLILVVLTVPPVRAAVIEFIQIGAVRIFFAQPSPSPDIPKTTETPPLTTLTASVQTRQPSVPGLLPQLGGETTLVEAEQQLGYPLLLPTFPADLGLPDHVYFQNLGGPAVFLIWNDPEQPEKVHLSLLIMGPGAFAGKGAPEKVEEITLNGRQALWLEGDHTLTLQVRDQDYQNIQLSVKGNVLLWESNELTYRLEGDFAEEEARKIAESLRPQTE